MPNHIHSQWVNDLNNFYAELMTRFFLLAFEKKWYKSFLRDYKKMRKIHASVIYQIL